MAEAMSSEREDRSRSPVRVPSDESGQGKSPEVETGVPEGGNQSAPGDQVGPSVVDVKPEGEKAEPGAIGAQDLAPTVPTPQEESSGGILLNSITSASKSLEMCAAQLEANASLLETMRADSSSINSLAADVNYYASTTKAAQAAQSANHKQVAWDWLSSSSDKIPLKDALRSIRHHSECTSKGTIPSCGDRQRNFR